MAVISESITGTFGVRLLSLENEFLKISLLPEVGGKIFDFVWKPTGKNFLWHNPRIDPQPYPIEANFDNYWCGGWDDVFPTCDECDFRGEHYPSLGELRSLRWKVVQAEKLDDKLVVSLETFGPISPVRVTKTLTLATGSPLLRVRHELTNLGPLPLDFLWGTHPALAVSGQMVLRVPAESGIVSQASRPEFGSPGQRYAWPLLETPGGISDMSHVRGADAGGFCGHYAVDLKEGWYAVEDTTSGQGFLLQFSRELFPCLWMWLAYGGYRGHHHVILEPWTGMPVHLAEAFAAGTHRHLEPGEIFCPEIRATIYSPPETCREAYQRICVPEGGNPWPPL